jgi:hypothetical protein
MLLSCTQTNHETESTVLQLPEEFSNESITGDIYIVDFISILSKNIFFWYSDPLLVTTAIILPDGHQPSSST